MLYVVQELGLSSDDDTEEENKHEGQAQASYFSEAPLELDVETFQAIKDYVMCTYRELSGKHELDGEDESDFVDAGPGTLQSNTFIEMKYPTISV